MKRWIKLIGVALILAITAYFLASDRNRTAITSGKGFITSGKKFGAQIGATEAAAHSALVAAGFDYKYDELGAVCGGSKRVDHEVKYYSDVGWRRGIVCLVVDRAEVTGVGWNYTLGAP